jgi:cytidylate kinase
LRPAEDAVILDTTELDVSGVLTALRALAAERGLVEHGQRGHAP